MEDVRMLTRQALETLFSPELIFAEEFVSKTKKGFPDELVIFRVISDVDTHHADNINLITRKTVDVTWLCKNLNLKLTRPLEVVRAMKAAGFQPINRGMDIPRDPGATHYGVASDYYYYQVNANG